MAFNVQQWLGKTLMPGTVEGPVNPAAAPAPADNSQNPFMQKILSLLAGSSNLNDAGGRDWLAQQGAPMGQVNPDSAAKNGYMNDDWWLGDSKNPMPAVASMVWKPDDKTTITVNPQAMTQKHHLLAAELEAKRKKLGLIGMNQQQ